jgi:tetratricopeptide (TPR) repeat protein
LIEEEPRNAALLHLRSTTHDSMGDASMAQDKLDLALKAYQAAANSARTAIKQDVTDKQGQGDLDSAVAKIGGLAYKFVLARDFAKALKAGDIANSFSPDEVLLIQRNRAHALMFLERTSEARNIYLKYRQKSSGDKSWQANVSSDFADLRKHGLSHPLMDEIKKQFRAPVSRMKSDALPLVL